MGSLWHAPEVVEDPAELIGQMSELLNVNFDSLARDIDATEQRQAALVRPRMQKKPSSTPPQPSATASAPAPSGAQTMSPENEPMPSSSPCPLDTTNPESRIQDIQRLIADQIEDQPDGEVLLPVADLWHVDAAVDSPPCLRLLIVQFASEIAAEFDLESVIEPTDRHHRIPFRRQ
ncbi:hypothetical protein [Pseudomonas sp.]|uniref:hypothetical protein n=1 Tax=Pseudomonas sp. TaxID=306 RepID=UPI0031DEE1C3